MRVCHMFIKVLTYLLTYLSLRLFLATLPKNNQRTEIRGLLAELRREKQIKQSYRRRLTSSLVA